MPARPASAPARAPSRGAVTDTRVAALRICEELRNGALLDTAFERYAAVLDSRNRRWLQQLVYGMLRMRSRLDAVIEARVTGGISRLNQSLLDLLRLGAYQLLHMGGVPAYAAIAQSVELAKDQHGIGAGSLVNAVLRRIDRERDSVIIAPPSDPIDALALEYSHPGWLTARWVAAFGMDDTRKLLEANNTEPSIYVRPYNASDESVNAELSRAGALGERSALLEDGARLAAGAMLTELGAFRRGWIFVQDPAATLVAKYAAIPGGSNIADLCAAPGGKTLEVSRAAAGSNIFAGDRSLARLMRMRENLVRLRTATATPAGTTGSAAQNIHLFVADACMPPLRQVDAVLLDAPCTGTGTFRRHPDARWRMKVSDIAVMAALQRNLIRAAAQLVRPGGLLIYSTCSLEAEENDAQVDGLLSEQPDFRIEPPGQGTVPDAVLDGGRLRVLPQKQGVDGAFAVRLRKRA